MNHRTPSAPLRPRGLGINHHQKGTQVNHTTRSARTPFLRTGFFAVLSGPLRGGGSGAGFSGVTAGLRVAGVVALTSVALLALTVGSASALTTRQLQSQITGAGNPPVPFEGGSVRGLTTDAAGRLWVSDRARHAVERFSATGAYETQNAGTGSWGESTEVRSLAFSAAAGEVFAADSANEGHLFGLEPASAAFSGKDLALGLGGSIQVAADNSAGATGGDLYVSNGTKVIRIKATDASADNFTAGPGTGTNELSGPFTEAGPLAVAPSGDLYVAAPFEAKVFQFAPSGEATGIEFSEAGSPLEGFGSIRAIAVDPSNENLLVATGANRVFEFSSAGAYLREIKKAAGAEFQGVFALAVGPSGNAYVTEMSGEAPVKLIDVFGPLVTLPDVTTGGAEVHSVTAATVHGEVNPAGQQLTECFFEYGPTTAYGQTAECEPEASAIGEGNVSVPVEAQLENLTPGTEYHYRLVAANANGQNNESRDRTFATGASIDSTSASEVSATAAKLETEINPNGIETSYSFQYGTTTAYGSETPMPPAPLGSGTADVLRSAVIEGLQPATTYHFRVLATSSLGTVEGPDRSFTTQPASASTGLPDNRGWELVSPALKQGVPLGPITREGGVIQAAADGSAITYYAAGSIVSDPAGNRSAYNSQDLSTRTASGWSTLDISTPHWQPAGLIPGNASEYQLFSSDLSLGAVEPTGATPLSPQAGERTPYLRLPDGSYTPLVYPGNVPDGTHFGGIELKPEEFASGVHFVTATPDLSHLLLESPTSLVEGFETAGGQGIYESSAGVLTPVSLVPPGAAAICGDAAPVCEPSGASVGSGGLNAQLRNAISTDGSRVVFSTADNRLYIRDIPRAETLQLDAPQGGPGKSGAATFQLASTDGSRVFFTDPEQLTEHSTAAPGKPDLYMCEVEVDGEGHLACDLTDLTANALNASEPAAVQGAVIGAAEDGSAVYFVAQGALTTEPNQAGESAVSGDCVLAGGIGTGECNLYRYDAETANLGLVAVLSGADFHDWSGEEPGNLRGLTARVAPNGRFLAFMSERPLTGYDNRDAVSGERDEEVFLYDAAAEAGAGRLLCASCNPTGARPAGRQGPPHVFPAALVDGAPSWQNRWYAANVPGWTSVDNNHALYQSRYLSNSGRLFFNANDALVPQDSNGTEDVYQWEPPQAPGQPASNDCTASSPAYSPASGGCVSLISSGESSDESAFMDASESGDDVFFLTASRLTAKDEDKALDLYDARVGGGEAPPVKPVECSGDACQQPAVPPEHPTPGTLLVNGPGNAKQCPKGKKLQKGKCVQKKSKNQKHHKKSKKHAKKSHRAASHNRGGHK